MSQVRILASSSVASRGESQVFGIGPDLVNLWRIDASTDTLVWAVRLLDTVNGVAMGSGQLYALAFSSSESEAVLYAINLSNGSVIWSVDAYALGARFVASVNPIATDSAGNVYVAGIGGVRKFNSSGTLQGTYEPSDVVSAGTSSVIHVAYDAGADVLVCAYSGGTYGLAKFDTSLSELALTGTDQTDPPTFTRTFYSGESNWDDVWASMTDQTVGGWWFDPPSDVGDLPAGYPPSAVGRTSNAWSIGEDADLLFAVGGSAFVAWYALDSGSYYFHVKRFSGATDNLPAAETWIHVFTDFAFVSDPSQNTSVLSGWMGGDVLYVGSNFLNVGDIAGAVSVTIFNATNGSVTKQYRLGNASGLAGVNAIYGSGDDVYAGSGLAPRVMAVTA